MYNFCPYFTNDGTVGLLSSKEDDIYHSAFGALSESWQKFIIPSNLEQYIKTHKQVKILDLCYGIGYNTKTALNVFINNYMQEEIKFKKNQNTNIKNSSIETIHTDNYLATKERNFTTKNKNESLENKLIDNTYSEEIYADNDTTVFCGSTEAKNKINLDNEFYNSLCSPQLCNSILIDAVDSDKVLIGLSPYITRGRSPKLCFESKKMLDILLRSKQMTNSIIKYLPKKFKLRNEVPIIIFEKLIKKNSDLLKDDTLKNLLTQSSFSKFFDLYMVQLSNFYLKSGCKYNKTRFNSTFLHNIYYQYISRSYKNAQKVLKNNLIDLNFHHSDARAFIKSTSSKYNFIFHDAFTPAKCPTLWTVDFFRELHSKLEDDGMILTYSNSAAVRNAFLQNGFYVGKIYDESSSKFIGTVATKKIALIEHLLNDIDIAIINSKAGICFRDNNLCLDSASIIKNRDLEVACSNLKSSTKIFKEYKNAKI